ncbi:MAG: aldehyde dehydrogenase family protein [Candidatus Dormibacteria bacterium]
MAIDNILDSVEEHASHWRARTPLQRGEVLRRAADALEPRMEELATSIVCSVGKPIREARAEGQRAVAILRYVGSLGSASQGTHWASDDPETMVITVRAPLGLVGLITPFNFPVAIPVWKLAPALLGGNGVVLKPAAVAVEPARRLLDAFLEAGLPEGLVAILEGGGPAGQELVESPRLNALSFTGSVGVGRKLAAICAERGTRAQFELGGKNTSVVLADADLQSAARDIALAAFGFAGQKCTATSRVVVISEVAERFAELLSEATRGFVTGDPEDETVLCGPVITADKATELIRVVHQHRVLAQASAPTGGRFVAPTLLTDVTPGSSTWRDELFGPVLPILSVDSVEAAFEAANDGPFGLSAAIYTRNSAMVRKAMADLRAGVIAVNRPSTGLDAHIPFGGVKGSGGVAREQGHAGVLFYTEERTVYWKEPGL